MRIERIFGMEFCNKVIFFCSAKDTRQEFRLCDLPCKHILMLRGLDCVEEPPVFFLAVSMIFNGAFQQDRNCSMRKIYMC